MAKPMNLPMIASGEGSLNRYLQDIRKFPMLTPEEEYMFGKAWKEHQDPKAAERMITSHSVSYTHLTLPTILRV